MSHKPLLVLIPGTLCTSQVFQPIVKHLKYDSVLIDYKHHDSLQAMSDEVLHLVGSKPFIAVGFSMGGMVAFELIRRVSKQISGLILLNSNAHADLPGKQADREQHLALAKETNLTNLMQNVYLPVYFENNENNKNSENVESQVVLQMAETLGIKVFEAQLKVLAQRPDSLGVLGDFAKPTLIISGENDLPCPPTHQLVMADAAATPELHILQHSGHFAVLEQPQKIAKLINQWIKKYREVL
jgi:pimeloyl-ACP methyl ester carboxylesterase